jgi:hypothetical protein
MVGPAGFEPATKRIQALFQPEQGIDRQMVPTFLTARKLWWNIKLH